MVLSQFMTLSFRAFVWTSPCKVGFIDVLHDIIGCINTINVEIICIFQVPRSQVQRQTPATCPCCMVAVAVAAAVAVAVGVKTSDVDEVTRET